MTAEDDVSAMLGDPRAAIRRIAAPLLLSLAVASVNALVDRMWCSGLGYGPVAAIAVVLPLYQVLVGVGNGLGVGASSTVSRRIGAGDGRGAACCAGHAIVIGVLIGAVLTAVLLLVQDPVLRVIGREDILSYEVGYMLPYSASCILLVLNGVVMGLLRGEGAAKKATSMMLSMAVANMVLDPVLIYVLGMGLMGASVATVIAMALSVAIGACFYVFRRTAVHPEFEGPSGRRNVRDVLSMGLPQILEYVVMYSMNIALNYIVLFYAGAEGMAVYSVPIIVMDFALIPCMAIGSAIVPVASSADGQNDFGRMEEAYRYSLRLTMCIGVAIAAVLAVFAEWVLIPFTYSSDMLSLKPQMVVALRIFCLYVPTFALIPLGSGLLQALKHPGRSVVQAVVRNLLMIVLYIVGGSISLTGIFWAVIVGELVGGLMMYFDSRRMFRIERDIRRASA